MHYISRSRHPTQGGVFHAVGTQHKAVYFTQSAPNTRQYISRSRHLTQGSIFHAVGTQHKAVYFTQSALHRRRCISRSRHLTQDGIFHAVVTSRNGSICQAFCKFHKPRDPPLLTKEINIFGMFGLRQSSVVFLWVI